MNNAQFRRLVSDTPRADKPGSSSSSSQNASASSHALGSKLRASIPMTPRSLGGASSSTNDFARQVAAHRSSLNPKKERKFRSAAPLGSKLPEGYVDRARVRQSEDDDAAEDESDGKDDRQKRLIALMDLVREGKMDKDTAIEQTKLLGGDLSSTHLVKGLDFALLERARRGEDLLSQAELDKAGKLEEEKVEEVDLDDELDKALDKEVIATAKEKKVKQEAPRRRTRAEILEELKKSRQPMRPPTVPDLGSKFKRIQEKVPKVKSKKEKTQTDQHVNKKAKIADSNDKDVKVNSMPIGMLPPALPESALASTTNTGEEDDDDIFADAGDYDPLASLMDNDDDDEEDEEGKDEDNEPGKEHVKTTSHSPEKSIPKPRQEVPKTSTTKNYFGTAENDISSDTQPKTAQEFLSSNPEILAALKKAATLSSIEDDKPKPSAKHQAMLQASFRDDADIDMGFGGSRTFGDDDDDDGPVEEEGKAKKKGKKKKSKA